MTIALRLHTVGDVVYVEDLKNPSNVPELPLEACVTSNMVQTAGVLHVSAAVNNAALLLALYAQQQKRRKKGLASPRIWLENPRKLFAARRVYTPGNGAASRRRVWAATDAVEYHRPLEDPRLEVKCGMHPITVNGPGLSRSIGGDRDMEQYDFATYSLCEAVAPAGESGLRPEAMLWLRMHPAWPAISFLRIVDCKLAAAVIAQIVDPRWWRTIVHPDCYNVLYRVMGAKEQATRNLLTYIRNHCGESIDAADKQALQSAGSARLLVLSKMWQPKTWVLIPDDGPRLTPEQIASSFAMSYATRYAAVRIDSARYKSLANRPRLAASAIAETNRVVLQLITDVWCHNMQHTPRSGVNSRYRPELFVPEYFFGETLPEFAPVWESHMHAVQQSGWQLLSPQ